MKRLGIGLLAGLLTQTSLALKVGDEVSVDALTEIKFLQGTAPAQWEEGKVYVFEFWATWCGPCLQVIPHMDALYDKYNEKGLEVYGMNVKEADKLDKLKSFLEGKGDGMSYPIGLMEQDDAFDQAYYTAAGIRGIPHALVVKGGKLVMRMHPAQLNEAMVEKLLSPDTNTDELIAEQKKQNEQQEKTKKIYTAFSKAKRENNIEAMKAATAEAKEVNPEMHSFFTGQIMIAEKDWAGVTSFINALPEAQKGNTCMSVFVETDTEEGVSEELLKTMEPHLKAPGALGSILKSRLQVRLKQKEKAIELATQAVADAEKEGRGPVQPYKAFLKGIQEDNPISLQAFSKLLQSGGK